MSENEIILIYKSALKSLGSTQDTIQVGKTENPSNFKEVGWEEHQVASCLTLTSITNLINWL